MKEIELSKGYVALVDDEDYERVMARGPWYASKQGSKSRTWYAHRRDFVEGSTKKKVLPMHRFILPPPEGRMVDHINGNGLDNRKENLRLVTHQQNMHNARTALTNTSGVKGVSWSKVSGKWRADVWMNNRQISLGLFDCLLMASIVVAKAREALHGDFACHGGAK
jgi:hypothetical protein